MHKSSREKREDQPRIGSKQKKKNCSSVFEMTDKSSTGKNQWEK